MTTSCRWRSPPKFFLFRHASQRLPRTNTRTRSVDAFVTPRDATSLTKLFNDEIPTFPELTRLFKASTQRFMQLCTQTPADIDSLLQFYADAASSIDESIVDSGNSDYFTPAGPGDHRLPRRLATGPNVLTEHLVVELFSKIMPYTARHDGIRNP